jgi:hypothetical protein
MQSFLGFFYSNRICFPDGFWTSTGKLWVVWTPQYATILTIHCIRRFLTLCLDIWYAIDEVTGKGYMLGTQVGYNYGPSRALNILNHICYMRIQLLPFADPQLMDLKDEFEKLVWSIIQTPEREDLDKDLGLTQQTVGND